MTFLGLGYLEVLIILLIAFILLGPERMVDAARLMGKAVREVRKMAADLPSLDLDQPLFEPEEAPVVQRGRDRDQRLTDRGRSSSKASPDLNNQGAGDDSPAPGTSETDEGSDREDGPVAFRPSAQRPPSDEAPQDRT